MNIAFVTTYDGEDVLNWSGSSYYMSKSLKDQENNICYIGNLTRKVSWRDIIKKIRCRVFSRKDFVLDRTIAVCKEYSMQVAERLSAEKIDCIISPGSMPIAYLKTDIPKIFYTDATFAGLINYYSGFTNLSPEVIRQGHIIEKQALENCDLAIYSSEWAAKTAIEFYKVNPAKVKVVPFGANLEEYHSREEVQTFIADRDKSVMKILFNGVDWERKGGDFVLSVVEEIRRRGIKVEINLVGARDFDSTGMPPYIVNHGFLSKSVTAQKKLLEDLYKTCHFLVVPSQAEAYGLVFCEASAYGMPSIARRTGGITSIIEEGKNGFTVDSETDIIPYADIICEYFTDQEKYSTLAISSYTEFETRLNWKAAGESVNRMIKSVLHN
jgi:glycosyltransferase involved in cell wall biosynthesis